MVSFLVKGLNHSFNLIIISYKQGQRRQEEKAEDEEEDSSGDTISMLPPLFLGAPPRPPFRLSMLNDDLRVLREACYVAPLCVCVFVCACMAVFHFFGHSTANIHAPGPAAGKPGNAGAESEERKKIIWKKGNDRLRVLPSSPLKVARMSAQTHARE